MRLILYWMLFATTLQAWEDDAWLNEVKGRVDEEAISWLREKIKIADSNTPSEIRGPCKECQVTPLKEDPDQDLYICMSFSVPDSLWLDLSMELEQEKGVFVLRGLPDNSFKLLASKLLNLKKQGLNASIIVFPHIFEEYDITEVPSFIYVGKESHKITGAISLDYALSKIRPKEHM